MRWLAKHRFKSRQTERDRTLMILQPDPGQREDTLVVLNTEGNPVMRITAQGQIQFLGTALFWNDESQAFTSLGVEGINVG
jgi:hypothetical protein